MTKSDSYINIKNLSIKAFFWSISGYIVKYIVQLVTLAILARMISPGDFGVISLVFGVISFLDMVTQL